MLSSRMRAGLLATCLVLACTHAPTAGAPKTVAAAAPQAPAPSPFAVTLDFESERTAPPPGLWLRLKSPNTVLPRLIQLAADPSLRGFADVDSVIGLLLGRELSALVDLAAPISVVYSREAGTVVGAARPAKGAQFDPEKLGPMLRALGPGRWQLHPSDAWEKVHCELWHLAAPVGYRILCGMKGTELAPYAPYLLGQHEKTPPTADVSIGSTGFPLAESAESRKNRRSAAKPDATDDSDVAAAAMVSSLAKAESIALDISFLEQDLELALELRYAEADASPAIRSWFEKTPEALPPQFWRTLAVSPVALVSAGADERTSAALLTDPSVGGFFASLSPAREIAADVAEPMLSAMGGLMPERLRFTLSVGDARPALRSARESSSPRARSGDANGCWTLMGFAGSGERYLKGLSVLEELTKAKPIGAASKGAPAGRWLRLGKAPPDLPLESVIVRQQCADKSTCFSWIWPGPEWVWILSATTEAQMLAQARRVLPSLSDAGASGADGDQGAFGSEPPLIGVSASLAALKGVFVSWLGEEDMTRLPFGGSARIFATVTGKTQQIAGKPGIALRVTSRWSPAAVADLVELVKRSAHASPEREP